MRRRSLLTGAALVLLLSGSAPPPDRAIAFVFWETYQGAHAKVTVDGITLYDAPVADADGSTAISGGFTTSRVLPGKRRFQFAYGAQNFAATLAVTPRTRFVYLTPLSTPHIQRSETAYLLD